MLKIKISLQLRYVFLVGTKILYIFQICNWFRGPLYYGELYHNLRVFQRQCLVNNMFPFAYKYERDYMKMGCTRSTAALLVPAKILLGIFLATSLPRHINTPVMTCRPKCA